MSHHEITSFWVKVLCLPWRNKGQGGFAWLQCQDQDSYSHFFMPASVPFPINYLVEWQTALWARKSCPTSSPSPTSIASTLFQHSDEEELTALLPLVTFHLWQGPHSTSTFSYPMPLSIIHLLWYPLYHFELKFTVNLHTQFQKINGVP